MGQHTSRLNLYKPDPDELDWASDVNGNWDTVDALKLDDMAEPDDNTTLDASSDRHGLLPKLANDSDKLFNGGGGWTDPSETGDAVGPATNSDARIPQWNGANSKTLKDGLDVGTGANNLVQLDASAKLPAVDGSELTNLAGMVVMRNSDPSTYDWTKSSFTADSSYHDLDCSSIVPSGASGIIFTYYIMDNLNDKQFRLRKNGNSYSHEIGIAYTVANKYVGGNFWIPCDSDRKVEYYLTSTTWSYVYLSVIGWVL